MGKATGRRWGNKKPVQIIRKWRKDDVRYAEYEADFWEGPLVDGEEGEYWRRRFTAQSNRRLPDVSFRKELEAALK